MSNYYAPCFYRIHFVGIPSYIELPWINAAPLNVYVILHYHLYFCKDVFSNVYISVNTTLECSYLFFVFYTTERMVGGHQKHVIFHSASGHISNTKAT